ncbi:MAG TPA: D-glycero-beta-D-manno-heptose-7-phosphate kinase [Candidatus Binatia bacterium]
MTRIGVRKERLMALVNRFRRCRLLVVGDLMLDRFIWGDVERISPEAPVPVMRVVSESLCLGGAANVVHNICGLGGHAAACGVLGRDPAGKLLLENLKAIGSSTAGVFAEARLTTTQKSRLIARPRHQQLVRMDHENQAPVSKRLLSRVRKFVGSHLGRYDGLVISDYGKGVVHPELLEWIAEAAEKKGIPCVVDPKKENFDRYRNVTLVTPNTEEAGDAAGIKITDRASLHRTGQVLLDKWQAGAVLITQGQEGMSLFRRGGARGHFPTAARDVFDVTGAGDTVVATCALSLACRGTYEEAAVLANLAAGIVVGEVGTATVPLQQLRKLIREQV